MQPDPDETCVQRLTQGQSLKVRDATGCTVMCCAGTVWITQENDARDIFLTAGRSFTFDRPGLALIRAEEGMYDPWTGNPGMTVISLPAGMVARTRESRSAIITARSSAAGVPRGEFDPT